MSVRPKEQDPPKRALILAGGGLKVAFQAGVLQVWLDELRTESGERVIFQHADGASGGVFNLAMWCQGDSGRQIADKWRAFNPMSGISVNAKHWLPQFESLLTYDRFRQAVLCETWNLDWDHIRTMHRGNDLGRKSATFNLFNASRQQHVVVPHTKIGREALVSAVSLPFWFPAVSLEDGEYIDAVFATDANLEAAIATGANELWIIWTVSQRGTWRPGPINEYFQVIEASANSRVRAVLERIARNNAALAEKDGCGEFGRHIKVRWLSAEVPLHYLFDFTRGGMQDAVDRGVAAARRWVNEQPGFALADLAGSEPPATVRTLSFSEYFNGTFSFDTDQAVLGASLGAAEGRRLHIKVRADITNLSQFARDPDHTANLLATVEIPGIAPNQKNVAGFVQLFCDPGDYRLKQLTYRLFLEDGNGKPVTLIARKYVPHRRPQVKDPDDPYSGVDQRIAEAFGGARHPRAVWVDTTTLYTWLVPGHVTLENPGEPFAAGMMRVSLLGFLRSLASTRTNDGARGLRTYAGFFSRQILQAYLRPAVPPTQPPALATLSPQG